MSSADYDLENKTVTIQFDHDVEMDAFLDFCVLNAFHDFMLSGNKWKHLFWFYADPDKCKPIYF